LRGGLVFESIHDQASVKVDVGLLKQGVYVLVVFTNEEIYRKTFVKE
jgi:hypothetical protein